MLTLVVHVPTFRFYSLEYSLKPSWVWTIAQTGDRHKSSTLHPGQFLSISHFRRRWLYVWKDASEPSGKKWNYLSNVCRVIFQK